MPLSQEPSTDMRRLHLGTWRGVFVLLFLLIILFSFGALANIDKLARESALFQKWLHDQTEYMVVRDAEWNERFERIDTREAKREVTFKRIEKLLDDIDVRAKAKAR